MNQNSLAIQVICSHLATNSGTKPYEPKEWSELALVLMENKLEPKNMLTMDSKDLQTVLKYNDTEMTRLQALLNRSPALSFEISEYENMGIHFVTRADAEYPARLKKILGKACPPIFCYSGDLSILNNKTIGFVGSRNIDEKDMCFTKQLVEGAIEKGYTIVSGGAKGTDSMALDTVLEKEGYSIAFLSDSLIGKLKLKVIRKAVQEGQLLLISAVKPDAPWNVGNAMARNKYIYAQSQGTIVIKSDYNKGGTWSGATECLKNGWVPVYCWNNSEYEGNQALLKKGAVPIDLSWNYEISTDNIEKKENNLVNIPQQLSLFDCV